MAESSAIATVSVIDENINLDTLKSTNNNQNEKTMPTLNNTNGTSSSAQIAVGGGGHSCTLSSMSHISGAASESSTLEELTKEVEMLKLKLEEERAKFNDVECE